MPKVYVRNLAMSLDGYAAGPNQSLENPLGEGGENLHQWMVVTKTFRKMYGEDGGEEGLNNDFAARGHAGIGAFIMGRNMFGPVRGEWGESDWRGWWGDEPPYHHPVFVLTHHAHDPIPMEGGTTFHFVTDGMEAALEQATEAAGDQDVLIAGGASTVWQYLQAGLVDEVHLAVAPILLGGGARLFEGPLAGYECVELVSSPKAAHIRLARTATAG